MLSRMGLWCCALWVAAARAQSVPVMELTAGFHRIEAEVASDEKTRETGLMFRKRMASNHGMLFVFSQARPYCMWMRNTLLPLSVAFLDDQGQIINIEDMAPQTDDSHCALRPVRYALEMNLGWFKKAGLGKGATIDGLERLPVAE